MSRLEISKGRIIFVLLFLITNCGRINCEASEYFSSVAGLEELLKTELVILAELQDYVDSVINQAEVLQSEIDAIRADHLTASKDLEGYLNNPVNAYRLMKRLQSDWTTFEENIRDDDSSRSNFLEAMATHRQNLSFPTQDDVLGSTVALVRLQETYKLDVAQIASGILNGVKYGPAMSWQDCFTLGHHLYSMRDFNHTIPWMKQSMDMLIAQEYQDDPLSLDFIESVANYHQEMGDFQTALNLMNHILSVDAERENIQDTKVFLEDMITDGVKQGLIHETAASPNDYRKGSEYLLYEKVCRQEVAATPAQQRPLRCRYHTNNVAYRLLQPFQLEELYLDPYIVQLHDVISDKVINTIKSLSRRRLARSMVVSPDGGDELTSQFRTSKSAWFPYSEHPYMEKMRQHLQEYSGLNVDYAEELQVANYGIGGHYEPHYDFFLENLSYFEEEGNRAATGIYYLSDVEEGGATAFPYLPILVKPKKGSVLFWHNLHRSGEPDYRTKHAACPVLKGSKWIGNIWIRIRNQEREWPCGLEDDHELSLKYKDYA